MFKKLFSLVFVSVLFLCNINTIFADDFDASKTFAEYESYRKLDQYNNAYEVSKSSAENSKALFENDEQMTDFIYDSLNYAIDGNTVSFLATKKVDGQIIYGVLRSKYDGYNTKYTEDIPVQYSNIDIDEIDKYTVFVCTLPNNEVDYYVDEDQLIGVDVTGNFEKVGSFYKFKTIDEIPIGTLEKIEIDGLDGYYFTLTSVGKTNNYSIIDENNNVVSGEFPNPSMKIGKGNTIMGRDGDFAYAIVIDNGFKRVDSGCFYMHPVVVDNETYFRASMYDDIYYYDVDGNTITDKTLINKIEDIGASDWAVQSINSLLDHDVIPLSLQSDYKKNITREQFCELAMNSYLEYLTYIDYEEKEKILENSKKSPFTDVDNKFVTMAYNLGVVNGTGDNKFTPNGEITRQESAVMLAKLAEVKGEKITKNTNKFIDEKYFANWAKDYIYIVSGTREDNKPTIMSGTENNKFSPWLNYSREQAMTTICRMFYN